MAWVWYHCPQGTKYKFVQSENPPLGIGVKYPKSASKWPGYSKAKKYYGN